MKAVSCAQPLRPPQDEGTRVGSARASPRSGIQGGRRRASSVRGFAPAIDPAPFVRAPAFPRRLCPARTRSPTATRPRTIRQRVRRSGSRRSRTYTPSPIASQASQAARGRRGASRRHTHQIRPSHASASQSARAFPVRAHVLPAPPRDASGFRASGSQAHASGRRGPILGRFAIHARSPFNIQYATFNACTRCCTFSAETAAPRGAVRTTAHAAQRVPRRFLRGMTIDEREGDSSGRVSRAKEVIRTYAFTRARVARVPLGSSLGFSPTDAHSGWCRFSPWERTAVGSRRAWSRGLLRGDWPRRARSHGVYSRGLWAGWLARARGPIGWSLGEDVVVCLALGRAWREGGRRTWRRRSSAIGAPVTQARRCDASFLRACTYICAVRCASAMFVVRYMTTAMTD